jgi:hypothetical protein
MAPEKEVTPGELNESEYAALAQLAKAKKKKTEAEENRQQLLAEHAKNDCPRRKVTSRKWGKLNFSLKLFNNKN